MNEEMLWAASGLGAAWQTIVNLKQAESGSTDQSASVMAAVAYAIERTTTVDRIRSYRGMIELLSWNKRFKFEKLIDGLERLRVSHDAIKFINIDATLRDLQSLSEDFERCVPKTNVSFQGLWRRSHKAMDFSDYVRYIGSEHG